jgi:iron complex transport system substrate-binding protein
MVVDETSQSELTRYFFSTGEEGQTYHWRVKFVDDLGAESPWSAVSWFSTAITSTGLGRPPEKPEPSAPADNDSVMTLSPTLVLEDFSDPDADDSHLLTWWQISRTPDFASLVYELKSADFLTRLALPAALLKQNTLYHWRTKFFDSSGLSSCWSSPIRLKIAEITADLNENGIPDDYDVDSDVDLDRNGTADIDQLQMKSMASPDDSIQIGIKAFANVTAIDSMMLIDPDSIPDPHNRPDSLPFGLIGFALRVENPGDTASVQVFFSKPITGFARWYKHDPVNGWQDFSAHATFAADGYSVVLRIKDGSQGDADHTVNGLIVDPGGVGITHIPDSGSAGIDGAGGVGCFIVSFTGSKQPAGALIFVISAAIIATLYCICRARSLNPFLPVCVAAAASLIPHGATAVTVTDQVGRMVEISHDPQRVVAFAPSITEIVYALGGQHRLVGATVYSSYPAAARKLPRVGTYVRLDLERIVALKPDLCIATKDGNPRPVIDRLAALNIPVYVVDPRDLQSITRTISELGSILKVPDRAAAVVKDMRRRVAQVRSQVAGVSDRPGVFFQIGVKPIISIGSDTFIHELIVLAGGRNLAAGSNPYPRFSLEEVIGLAPDVIIITSMARQAVFEEVKQSWSRWPNLPAAKTNRIHLVDSDIFDRPSPRLVDGLEELAALLHPALKRKLQ